MKKICVGLLSLALMTSTSFAAGGVAVIGDVSGKVLVNKGEGFVPVVGSYELNAGDRVMIGQDSFATLTYAECAVSLSKPTVLAVAAAAPCADVVVTPTADLDAGGEGYAGLPLPFILLGTVAVGTGILLVSGVLDDDNNNCGLSAC